MSDESVQKIEIVKEIPFRGEGDSVVSRLRRVTLRGFPVRIYENAIFSLERHTRETITMEIHTPQTRIYRTHLDRVMKLHNLFEEQGVDIFNLDRGYDFNATSDSGQVTEWTMIPPVVERFRIPINSEGGFDYESIMAEELKRKLERDNLGINPGVRRLQHNGFGSEYFKLINDGSHRVESGLENGGITMLVIGDVTPGYPYYAAPQSYDGVQVFAQRTEALEKEETKIHILKSPGHKELYRNFPSGGIKSGTLRHDPKLQQ